MTAAGAFVLGMMAGVLLLAFVILFDVAVSVWRRW